MERAVLKSLDTTQAHETLTDGRRLKRAHSQMRRVILCWIHLVKGHYWGLWGDLQGAGWPSARNGADTPPDVTGVSWSCSRTLWRWQRRNVQGWVGAPCQQFTPTRIWTNIYTGLQLFCKSSGSFLNAPVSLLWNYGSRGWQGAWEISWSDPLSGGLGGFYYPHFTDKKMKTQRL